MKILLLVLFCLPAAAVERPGIVFKVFQFPANRIPRIDGNTADWDIVPPEYAIGTDQLADTKGGHGSNVAPRDIDVRVRVGWVKGLNRLFVLYEAYDNYWDFARNDMHNDMFELVVDGDFSGGPFIKQFHPSPDLDPWAAYESFQSVHAQNYHIFTPPSEGKEWAMTWGCQQPWLRELPYSNAAYSYDFQPGQGGRLTLEFWITPFDYASCRGPKHSLESELRENKIIGMSWAVKDFDDVSGDAYSFWNLSHKTTMYGNASDLVAFRLMPLEARFRKPLEAQWSFQVLDLPRRVVAFHDESYGAVGSWRWDFGDGTDSRRQHPVHTYEKGGRYIVTLDVEGAGGKSRRTKVWDVVLE